MTIFIVKDMGENLKAFYNYDDAEEYCNKLNEEWRAKENQNDDEIYYWIESIDVE